MVIVYKKNGITLYNIKEEIDETDRWCKRLQRKMQICEDIKQRFEDINKMREELKEIIEQEKEELRE